MKIKTWMVLLFVVCLLGGTFSSAQAKKKPRARVDFEKIEIHSVPTPVYQARSHPQGKSEDDWFQIYTKYAAQGGRNGWIDELQFKWYVLIKTKSGKYALLTGTVDYVDVETKGEAHNAVVYIRPGFVRRYYGKDRLSKNDVWIRVEAYVNGVKVGSENHSRSASPGERWWLVKEPKVKIFDREVFSRDKTPFAPLDYDFYEQIKVEAGR